MSLPAPRMPISRLGFPRHGESILVRLVPGLLGLLASKV
jgi:hypothetical protein